MVPLMSLLLPILLAAVLVFVASSVIHMLLPYHRTDFAKVPKEDQVMAAMRPFAIPPGEYVIPYAGSPAMMKDPDYLERVKAGPAAFITVAPSAVPTMGAQLALWFAYCVVVGVFAAYVTGSALPAGADALQVFRFSGTVTFISYTVANWQNSIWYRRAWSTTLKNTFDGLVYALLTAGVFSQFWPV